MKERLGREMDLAFFVSFHGIPIVVCERARFPWVRSGDEEVSSMDGRWVLGSLVWFFDGFQDG